MSIPRTMLSRQVRNATGSIRGQVNQSLGNSSRNSQVRSASSSSSSSSSIFRNNNLLYAAPFIVIAGAAGVSVYRHSNQEPHAIDPNKRKAYWQRMAVEERKQQQAQEENSSSKEDDENAAPVKGNEEVVSESTHDLAEEASQESAFDPETNTINWDCPCLGGMAHGPCGEEFKTAFSCFVFSEAEPKGIDCVENFKAMQDCFRKHPEHYKDEIEDDEEFESQERSAGSDAVPSSAPSSSDKSHDQGDADEDEGVREFRREMSKES